MNYWRNRCFAVVLFGLLTLGQAYPFAAAWGIEKKKHPCCCATEIAKPCDCDHGGTSSVKKRKFRCHSETRMVGISPAPCGTKTETLSLNFRGENCLPRFASLVITTIAELRIDDLSVHLPKFSAVPEPPPPRVD